ncbi:DUF6531 domain-containing protein [Luteimonas sp. C4P040a]|nr:DUF6531 domain-containing protein [Luteimonas fraxinea]
MNATGRRRIRNSIANFIAGLAAIASPTLSAQESDQVFTVYDYENRLIGEYKTQAEAESAIREIPGPFEFFSDIFSYAREIKETIHTEDGKVRIVYWLGLDQPTDLEWRYPMGDQYFDNEADALQEQIAITNSNFPHCAVPTAVFTGGWEATWDNGDIGGERQVRPYSLTYFWGDDCGAEVIHTELDRLRKNECPSPPLYTFWMNSYGACVNEWAVASIVTTVSECPTQGASSGLVGNPCDVKTGEKVQNEEDFELDWVDLSRTYRSGVAYSTGGFGAGLPRLV